MKVICKKCRKPKPLDGRLRCADCLAAGRVALGRFRAGKRTTRPGVCRLCRFLGFPKGPCRHPAPAGGEG